MKPQKAKCGFICFSFSRFVAHGGFFLAFCRFMSFNFGLLWLHDASCAFHIQPFVPSFPFILAFSRFMSFSFGFFVASCPLMSALCGFTSFHFGLLWLHLLSCRLCVTLFYFIFVFCAFICFHFGFVAASFLFTLVVSFPSILAFCAPLFYSF